jgi:hypothetical protein
LLDLFRLNNNQNQLYARKVKYRNLLCAGGVVINRSGHWRERDQYRAWFWRLAIVAIIAFWSEVLQWWLR